MKLIETPRLRIRPWMESNAEALFKYASDPDVGPRAGWPPHQSVEEGRGVIQHIFSNDHTWAIEMKENGEVIGCIGYYPYGESNIRIGERWMRNWATGLPSLIGTRAYAPKRSIG